MIFLLPFCHASLDNVGPSKRQKVQKFLIQKVEKILFTFTVHRLLFTDYCLQITIHWHCSLLLFMTLFTPKSCLFKGSCPLNFRVFQVKFSSDFFSLRTSLLRERTHPTSTNTTLFILVHYKLCNSTNLVTRTSSSFVIVNL